MGDLMPTGKKKRCQLTAQKRSQRGRRKQKTSGSEKLDTKSRVPGWKKKKERVPTNLELQEGDKRGNRVHLEKGKPNPKKIQTNDPTIGKAPGRICKVKKTLDGGGGP